MVGGSSSPTGLPEAFVVGELIARARHPQAKEKKGFWLKRFTVSADPVCGTT